MAKLNLLVFLNSYSDDKSTNAADQNGIKWTREMDCLPVLDAGHTNAFQLAPGETKVLFDATRVTDQDNTTQYSLSLNPTNPNTYRLTATGGTLPNFRTPRNLSIDATTSVTVTLNGPVATFSAPGASAAAAQFVGQIAGMTSSVTIVALTAGAAGNVTLPADGTSSINQLIVGWNTSNPSNQLQLQAGDDSQVPTSGANFVFTGGLDAVTAMNTSSIVIGDMVRVGTVFNSLNQGEWKVISKAANSFSIANPIAAAEGPIVLTSDFANQIQVYSALGIQVNDTLVISSGFSPVSWGSFFITAVAANWLEFYSTLILPQESAVMTEVAIYESAKRFIYLEADQNCSIMTNGSAAGTVEPWIMGLAKKPGQYMRKATIYSMSVTNTSTNAANLVLASVE